MDSIGAEVGQKMRSAIKAKLMELGCYVDDELPDYIMVMVANKRTKSQMNEDLQLFLTNKTVVFVDWLQIVLKKLKEITVTNPEVYKRVSKRKSEDLSKLPVKLKKEKKEKAKSNKKAKKKDSFQPVIKDLPHMKSLTDDLPVEASKLSEMRKIVVMQENQNSNSSISNVDNVNEDSFDIPPLSEVAMSNENELVEIEKKIRSVKSRLGLQVPSESEDEDFLSIKAEPEDLFPSEQTGGQKCKVDKGNRKIQLIQTPLLDEGIPDSIEEQEGSGKSRIEHPRIIFGNENIGKKQSVLERLGKKSLAFTSESLLSIPKRTKISLANIRREEEEILGISKLTASEMPKNANHGEKETKKATDKYDGVNPPSRESALKRLGVMSKVAVPQKEFIEVEEETVLSKDVPSAVKVKPRVLPPTNSQANKNLLLKAVAEAQRSIAQTPVVGTNNKPEALFTKKYREKLAKTCTLSKKLSNNDKDKIKTILEQSNTKSKKEVGYNSDDDNLEYVPKPVKKVHKSTEEPEYIPSTKDRMVDDDNYIDADCSDVDIEYDSSLPRKSKGQTFIITLDGISRRQDDKLQHKKDEEAEQDAKKQAEKRRKQPSPIIFDSSSTTTTSKGKPVPDRLPIVHPPPTLKTKERCKYWPMCRQGEKCEFVHPSTPCKAFPQCKFGEKCLYVHPTCKFETSCTRKDCPYSHSPRTFGTSKSAVSAPQMCKFYPNCNNSHCMYYHPKPCKYGRFCKNQAECSFSHGFSTKSNFTWRSTIKL